MTSFTNYMSSHPTNGDPKYIIEARNYMTGKFPNGQLYDPCEYTPGGGVLGGVDCNLVNPLYWFSGDPLTNIGWLDTMGTDQRIMVNTGPFQSGSWKTNYYHLCLHYWKRN